MENEEKPKKAAKERFTLGSVATQTETVIVDAENDKQYTVHEALAKVLNNQEKLMVLLH